MLQLGADNPFPFAADLVGAITQNEYTSMSETIAIVDYQMGNLRSVQKALESVGATAVVTCDPEVLASAPKLILPGVGAFGDAMRELKERGLVEPLKDFIRSGRPVLGICLGLQLLFEESSEGGRQLGLGVFPGTVERFEGEAFARPHGLKVPHMGWNQVRQRQPDLRLLKGCSDQAYFYFVHSYYCQPADSSLVWLDCNYGLDFCAAISRGNVYATQFHPEKSQAAGLKLLKNFATL
jgi:glutamine amidotransferase